MTDPRAPFQVGSVLTAVGAGGIAGGTMLPWLEVGLVSDVRGTLDSVSLGIDLTPGTIELLLGVAMLVVLATIRWPTVTLRPVRLGAATGLVLGAIAGMALAVAYAVLDATKAAALNEAAVALADAMGSSVADAGELLRRDDLLDVETGAGPWISAAGGAVALFGAVLVLARVLREWPAPEYQMLYRP
jgi:hypothetical protein